jgi:hypothetical protein
MVICGFDLGIIERALARDHVQARLPPAARLVGSRPAIAPTSNISRLARRNQASLRPA